MKLIPLSQGFFAQVDDENYEDLIRFKWQAGIVKKTGYKRAQRLCAITGKTVLMHRQVMNVSGSHAVVDHKDRNPLNNQKPNLRVCTHQQNSWNQSLGKLNTSGYKGVFWNKANHVFSAKIRVGNSQISIGFLTVRKMPPAHTIKRQSIIMESSLATTKCCHYSRKAIRPDQSQIPLDIKA